jgi:hypothetical protein
MKKPIPELNAYYQERLDSMVRDNGATGYFTTSTINKIRPLYNRIFKNPIGKVIAAKGEI